MHQFKDIAEWVGAETISDVEVIVCESERKMKFLFKVDENRKLISVSFNQFIDIFSHHKNLELLVGEAT